MKLFVAPLLLLTCAFPVIADDTSTGDRQQAEQLLEVIDAVHERHIDPPTRQELVVSLCRELTGQTGLAREVSRAKSDEQLQAIIVSALRSKSARSAPDTALQNVLLGSRIPVMISKKEDHRVNQQVAENRYVGTGIQLKMEERPIMMKVFEDGPAWKVGAKDGDIIETIDGETTRGLTIVDVVKKLRGPSGSSVEMTLRQPNEDSARQYTVTRGMVPIRTIEKPVFNKRKDYAYVKLTSISASSVHELRKIERRLPEQATRVVLDFRGIAHHNLHHGRLLASALIDNGIIGTVVGIEGKEEVKAEPGRLFDDRQLVVLVGQFTRGTPEWIAAALQHHKIAKVCGQPSAGAGYVTEGVEVGLRVADVPVASLRTPGDKPLLVSSAIPLRANFGPTAVARTHQPPASFAERVTPDVVLPPSFTLESVLKAL